MLRKYATYTVEDFVKDENFIDWAKLFHTEYHAVWQDVISRYPYQREVIEQARQVVLQLSEASKLPAERKDVEDIWTEIELAITERESVRNNFFRRNLARLLTAASVILIMGMLWYQFQKTNDGKPGTYSELVKRAKGDLEEVTNTETVPLVVLLPDGSKVTMSKDSRLSYGKAFNGREREVFLSGEAFFEVTRNPAKPFLVYANGLITKVLGTSFRVTAFERDVKVVVAVKTGKVSVFSDNEDRKSNVVTLIPNQQAVFSRKQATISRSLVSRPQVIVSESELMLFSFSNAPVTDIFEALRKAYGVDIIYDKEMLAACRLTTSLSNETLFERLDVICEAIEAEYKVVDAQVIISGTKCN
ncbi:hypothetical protein DYBT9275_04473 [Dyadobacter sp. CECT 9275]|uniref:FecR family protein n=1 Tax=Dyadobacter helix TaxID=2822344 RepID=A0A916JFH0_9BACT|nr:FecR family protein [Dyadobacter sp. CECT 9275]CAG5009339.1 hypothetical protein DYBT9275_04473 [Dyadobacter sp. CECT 9275]